VHLRLTAGTQLHRDIAAAPDLREQARTPTTISDQAFFLAPNSR